MTTSPLTALREDLAKSVSGGGLTVYTHIPGRLALPGAFIAAENPYIQAAETFGLKEVRLDLVVAVATGSNQSETTALDDKLGDIIRAVEADDWLVESVSQPFIQEYNNAQALTAILTISCTSTLS